MFSVWILEPQLTKICWVGKQCLNICLFTSEQLLISQQPKWHSLVSGGLVTILVIFHTQHFPFVCDFAQNVPSGGDAFQIPPPISHSVPQGCHHLPRAKFLLRQTRKHHLLKSFLCTFTPRLGFLSNFIHNYLLPIQLVKSFRGHSETLVQCQALNEYFQNEYIHISCNSYSSTHPVIERMEERSR